MSRRRGIGLAAIVLATAVAIACGGGGGDGDEPADCLRIDPTTFQVTPIPLEEARQLADWIRLPDELPEPERVLIDGYMGCPESVRAVQVSYEGPDDNLTLIQWRRLPSNAQPRETTVTAKDWAGETPVAVGDRAGQMGYQRSNDEVLFVTWDTDALSYMALTDRGLTPERFERFLEILESIPE